MGNLTLNGATSGQITISPPAVAGTNTLTLPAATGTVALTANPTFTGTVTATTITSPAATNLTIQSAGTTAMTIDTSQNVGIGTSSPGARLQVTDGNFNQLYLLSSTTVSGIRFGNTAYTNGYIYYDNGANLTFQTNGAERARIDSSGNLLVGTTTVQSSAKVSISFAGGSGSSRGIVLLSGSTASTAMMAFVNPNGYSSGEIITSGTSTSYNTSSDYRLKQSVVPMTTGLATVVALKPVTYKWNADNSDGEGFLAHELQAVIPNAVTGIKDAVDANGKPVYQGVDYSKIVVHLVAALQELKATVDAQAAEITALKVKVGV